MDYIVYLITLVIAFLCGGFVYRCGIKDGSALSKGKEVKAVNPIKAAYNTVSTIKATSDAKKAAKVEDNYARNVFTWNGSEEVYK